MAYPKIAIEMPTRGIEPRTSGLQDLRSTTELYGLVLFGHAHLAKFEKMSKTVCQPMRRGQPVDKKDRLLSLHCEAHHYERTTVNQLPHMTTIAESR